MLTNPTAGRRLTGRLMVVVAVAVALPLTATRAINYVDVPNPDASRAPAAAAEPDTILVPAVAPEAPAQPVRPPQEGDTIVVNGQSKTWRDLTPAEKAEVRRSIAAARQELARTRIDREEIDREIREAMAEVKIDRDEMRRDLAEAQADIDEAMKEIDAHAVDIRRSGQDPEQLKATIRVSLKAVENIDVEAITRQALASVDHRQIAATVEASVAAAEAAIAATEAELEELEELDRDD